jgi:hypothetical protein
LQDAVQVQEQGGFAGSIRPYQGCFFAWGNDEVDLIQSRMTIGVAKRKIADLNRVMHDLPQQKQKLTESQDQQK